MKVRLLAVVALALALPAPAWAHARLVRTTPADGSVLANAPPSVEVVFDDVVRPGPGIEAVRNNGGAILAGRPRVVGGRTLVLPLRPRLADGDYSVRWAIVSDDGHLESGVIAFAVGAGRPAPTAALAAERTGPKAADIAARWLLYAGLLLTVGVALLALFARPGDGERVALLLSTGSVVAAVGAGDEAHRVGLDTRAGTALGALFVAAVVVATLAGAATLERRVLRPALVVALGLVVPLPFAGHALDHGVNRIEIPIDALHIAGAAAWVGALVGIAVFRDTPRRRAIALAIAGVALLGLTGALRAWSELSHASQLWHTSYGRTLLVKTAILIAALAGGWVLRARIQRRAGAELALVAGAVVAVSVLVLLPPGRSVVAGYVHVPAAEPAPQPPLPPRGAVVVAKELGELGVALELEPRRTTAIVLSPAGGGLDGLDVHLDGRPADVCGTGCYRVDRAAGKTVQVEIGRFGPPLDASFDVPQGAGAGAALLRRVEDRFRTLRSVFYLEHLASGPAHSVTALWRLESPNRIWYQIPGGAEGIVIGDRRWDRSTPDMPWQKSAQTQLPQPSTQWSSIANVHVVADDGTTKTLTFVDPTTPAYFRVTIDAHTLLPRTVDMTAAAHFMVDRYVRFNAPRAIYRPR